jgi:hypothetical protein
MSKSRLGAARPLLRKSATDPQAKLSARKVQTKSTIIKAKKQSNKDDVMHLHQTEIAPSYMTRPIPWWVFPEALPVERGLLGGLFGGGGPGGFPGPGGPGGPGGFPGPGGPGGPGGFPGPGGPGGPGGFPGPGGPGGPGGFPGPGGPGGPGGFPGPGGPGGPGGFPGPGGPGGPGGFPGPGGPGGPGGFPGPGGPGTFPPPPPRPPFPPGPGPFPIPIPIPIPIPGPQPFPPSYITVRIVGGTAFPRVNYTNYIPFYPGITIRQALVSTGLVDFGPAGFIRNVAGIPIYGNTEVRLRYQGRVVPQTLLNFPAEPGSTITLELYYSFVDAIPIPL